MTVIVTSDASVAAAITGNPIRNGSVVVGLCKVAGTFDSDPSRAVTYPSIDAINTKYNKRFNAPRYYAGDTAL